jgi:hypothetical protein
MIILKSRIISKNRLGEVMDLKKWDKKYPGF